MHTVNTCKFKNWVSILCFSTPTVCLYEPVVANDSLSLALQQVPISAAANGSIPKVTTVLITKTKLISVKEQGAAYTPIYEAHLLLLMLYDLTKSALPLSNTDIQQLIYNLKDRIDSLQLIFSESEKIRLGYLPKLTSDKLHSHIVLSSAYRKMTFSHVYYSKYILYRYISILYLLRFTIVVELKLFVKLSCHFILP